MPGWIIFGVWFIGFIPTWRRSTWVVTRSFVYGEMQPEGEDVAFGLVVGAFIATFWPAFWLVYALYYLETRHGLLSSSSHGFMKPPRAMRREEELNAREERIAKLEREVGIRN